MIEIRCVHDLDAAEPHRAAINALNLASAAPDPFSTFEFYQHQVRHSVRSASAADPRLWLLLAFDGATLVGHMALQQQTRWVLGMRAARLGWLTAYHADRPHLVTQAQRGEAVGNAMYAYLLSRKPEWSLLEFEQQDAGSVLRAPPAAAQSGACRFRTWPNMANGTITLRWSSSEAYFSALSQKTRSNVSRQMRNLLAAGEVELLRSSDPRGLPALFELYCAIESHSWKAKTEEAFVGGHDWTQYYASLMHETQSMRIDIQVLMLDGVPIAGMISGAFDNGLYALHTVYDERVGALGPGSAIFMTTLCLAIAGGYRFINLLWGFGYYKERWLAQMTPTDSLQIVRTGTPYYWRQLLGNLARACKEALRGHIPESINPVRHHTDAAHAVAAHVPGMPLATSAELARYRLLIDIACNYPAEHLHAVELAALMPFTTQRAAPT